MAILLSFEGVSKSFGALKVTDNLRLFEVEKGEALGILGPNGAGKTTVFNLITGGLAPNAGRIQFNGRDITKLAPHERCRAGIGRSYQVALPFEGMTVFENLLVGAMFGGGAHTEKEANDRCVELLDRTDLLDKANRMAGSLTLLDRKRLELARALATRPELLLLDEIAGGLTDRKRMRLWISSTIFARRASPSSGSSMWCMRCSRWPRGSWSSISSEARRGRAAGRDGEPGSQARLHGHRGLIMAAIFEVRNLVARYGDFQALFGIDFDMAAQHRRPDRGQRRRQINVSQTYGWADA